MSEKVSIQVEGRLPSSGLSIRVSCKICGQQFAFSPRVLLSMGHTHVPKRCPACCDVSQDRPDQTFGRKCLFSSVARVHSLPPGEWVRVQNTANGKADRTVWHLTLKGKYYGADWRGRIDIWAHTVDPPKAGDVVEVAHMQVRKTVAIQTEGRFRLDRNLQSTVDYEVSRRVPLTQAGNEGVQIKEETTDYVSLLSLPPGTRMRTLGKRLLWAEAYSKTTFKGLGRQFEATLDGGLWHMEVRGGVRSGRATTTAWLAVADFETPVLYLYRDLESLAETTAMIPRSSNRPH